MLVAITLHKTLDLSKRKKVMFLSPVYRMTHKHSCT